MQHHTLDEITQVATVQPASQPSWRVVRRERLRRLAEVLRAHTGPFRLLDRIEYLPAPERLAVRGEFSPLALAYQDAALRREGLAGDSLGDAMTFFGLSHSQAHHLFCDCHYGMSVEAPVVAARVRAIADQLSFREWWDRIRASFRFA
jgi:hypothetical protein